MPWVQTTIWVVPEDLVAALASLHREIRLVLLKLSQALEAFAGTCSQLQAAPPVLGQTSAGWNTGQTRWRAFWLKTIPPCACWSEATVMPGGYLQETCMAGDSWQDQPCGAVWKCMLVSPNANLCRFEGSALRI